MVLVYLYCLTMHNHDWTVFPLPHAPFLYPGWETTFACLCDAYISVCSKHPQRTGAILLGVSSVGERIFISAFALVDTFGATALWRTCAAGRHNGISWWLSESRQLCMQTGEKSIRTQASSTPMECEIWQLPSKIQPGAIASWQMSILQHR